MGTQDTVDVLVDAFAVVARRRPGAARLRADRHGRRRPGSSGDASPTSASPMPSRGPVGCREPRCTSGCGSATVGVSPDVDDPYTRLCTMIKVSEYLAAGVPAIVADLPENRATAGDAAAYFRAGDVDDLADRLEEVLFDPRRRGDGRGGRPSGAGAALGAQRDTPAGRLRPPPRRRTRRRG